VSAQAGEKISLAPFALTDADELYLVRGDAEAMAFWDWPADERPVATRAAAAHMLDDIAHGDARIWTIRRDRDGAFIGVVDLGGIGERSADLGFMIRRDFWGRGYAFGAATLAVRHGWAMGLARLNARCHEDNRRSQRLLLRLGFTTLEAREMEIRPGVTRLCRFFALNRPRA
jgi:RimJ/RimL family protein N-acetyltransferase